jgi:hypothetical protein
MVFVLGVIGLALVSIRRTPARAVQERVTGMLVAAPLLASLPPPPAAARTRSITDPDLPPVPPDSMPTAGAVPKVARTWTKVHGGRSVKADLVAVLLPGDTVLVDSLRGRWWRVALEGRVVGYVYAGTLIGD